MSAYKLSDEELRDPCRLGEGEACCRYIVFDATDGFRCAKHQDDLARTIDSRVAAGLFTAKGDNCPGKGSHQSGRHH